MHSIASATRTAQRPGSTACCPTSVLRPSGHRPLATAAAATLLCLGMASPVASWAQGQAPVATDPGRAAASGAAQRAAPSYALSAGPLAEVLTRFAAEAGVLLVFKPESLRGLNSPGLRGRYEVADGFAALLAGSGWQASLSPTGGYTLQPQAATSGRDAAHSEDGDGAHTMLPVTRVSASRASTPSHLHREMLRMQPAVNGDLTSQLRLNPNIQYSESQLSSSTGGEIAPAEISIHGAKPYQNEMLVDGISLMNDLDPGNKVTTTSPAFIPGNAQSLAVDSSLLCEVEVKDASVSAEYGRFTGGVVEAKLCSARKRLGGSVSVGYTSSDWTQVFIDPARREAFENSSSADLQPHFEKRSYKASLEARSEDGLGLLVGLSRQESSIPLKRFDSEANNSTLSHEVTQHRAQDSLVAKLDWKPADSRHSGDLTLLAAPSRNSYFIENYRNSDYDIVSGGGSLSGRLVSRYELATLTQQFSWGQTEQSRRSDADYYRQWRWSTDKNWGDSSGTSATSGEGAWGDVDQQLKTASYKLKASWQPLTVGETQHEINSGLELRRQQARYARLKDQAYYLTPADLPTTGAIAKCQLADGSTDNEACSATVTANRKVGQYFTRLMTYQAGHFDLNAESYAAYAEDEISWEPFSLRLGLRADQDSLTDKTSIAPRSRLQWQASPGLTLDAGVNRYYGRNLFAFALQEQVNTLMTTQTRRNTLTWGTAAQSKPLNRLEDLRTPYDDELSTGAETRLAGLGGPLSLRLTWRDGRDQIVQRTVTQQSDCNGNQCYVYTNDGRSRTRDLTLAWSSDKAFKTGPLVHMFWLAFNKSQVRSNYATYAEVYSNAKAADEVVQYDGRFIRYSELPADNYNRPWTLRLGALSTLPSQQLSVSQVLRVRDSYAQRLQTGSTDYEGATVPVYRQVSLPKSVTWDTVIRWTPKIAADQQFEVKLTVENLTNRRNTTTVSDSFATYERGRAVALELGFSF